MTGSGSAVFAPLCDNTPLPTAPGEWFMAKVNTLHEHPLKNWVEQEKHP
jgi:4-diphosphocytidyl-2-C-methyl-D-erythritol kinase